MLDVSAVPVPKNDRRWPLVVAAALVLMGAIVLSIQPSGSGSHAAGTHDACVTARTLDCGQADSAEQAAPATRLQRLRGLFAMPFFSFSRSLRPVRRR